MRIQRHTKDWWLEPNLMPARVRVPKRLQDTDPTDALASLSIKKSAVAKFKHSRLWVRYGKLSSIDTGYIVPLYDLRAIARRYGLSDNSSRYFRKYILPEPFDIVRRRSVNAHHWSRFTLMALDVVMLDLEKRGVNQFLKYYDDHVALVHTGNEYLEHYYANKANESYVDPSDKFGVQWLT